MTSSYLSEFIWGIYYLSMLEISQVKQNHICLDLEVVSVALKIEISDCNEFGFFGHLLNVYRKIFLASLITSLPRCNNYVSLLSILPSALPTQWFQISFSTKDSKFKYFDPLPLCLWTILLNRAYVELIIFQKLYFSWHQLILLVLFQFIGNWPNLVGNGFDFGKHFRVESSTQKWEKSMT